MRTRERHLGQRFYTVDSVTLARSLLGQRLVRVLDDGARLAGLIVEAEAYLGTKDMAAHSFGGRRSARNEAMFMKGGTAYVYFTYGMHFCFNVVAGNEDEPIAVLIRALEPVEGIETMRQLRSPRARGGKGKHLDADLCRGPARLCQALAIDRTLNAIDLTRDRRLFIERGPQRMDPRLIGVSPRIGIDYAGDWVARPLRFYLRGSRFISGPARMNR
jgi:DNA-3-methyladenine glycosylase